MDSGGSRRSRLPPEVWERFISIVRERGARAPADRWYVHRAEQFEKFLRNTDLQTCTATDVNAYLPQLDQQGRLRDWQFRQAVDSLEILLAHVLKLPWAAEFDWAFWRNSARRLESSHPTIARRSASEDAITGRAADGTAHSALLEALASGIRRRDYSVRTQQTYMQWVRRFITHFGGSDPRGLGENEVKAFLEHLTVRRNVAANTQNQALSALVFLYCHVLERSLELDGFVRAKRPHHLRSC